LLAALPPIDGSCTPVDAVSSDCKSDSISAEGGLSAATMSRWPSCATRAFAPKRSKITAAARSAGRYRSS
jgi:hypothetical protein